jgi:aldehyde:ferredoxin oxidoreductase
MVAKMKGVLPLMDSLVVCTMSTPSQPATVITLLNAVTGWDFTWEEAWDVGRRSVDLLRAASTRRGYTPAIEAPSPRYGGKVYDGPNAGLHVIPVWDEMKEVYYQEMGWDPISGKPLPETLKRLGLADIIPDLWPQR